MELINLSLFVFDDIDHVIWNKFTDELIRDINLDIKDSLIVKTFSLNHFSVMDSNGQENGIHDLSENELEILVSKLCHVKVQYYQLARHVYDIGDQEMSEHHIPHKEYERQGQLYLELVKAGLRPFANIFHLKRKKYYQHDYSVE